MASAALARRTQKTTTQKRVSSAPPKRRAAIRKVGGAIARKAASHAASAVRRVKADTKTKQIAYGSAGAIAGAVLEAKVSQIPANKYVPKQLMIGAVLVGGGFFMKGKVAEGALYAGMGPLFAGFSQLATRVATTGQLSLAGDDSYGYPGDGVSSVQGEFDDIAR